jgi:glycyl-tRNA synthetase beta subunit
MPEPAIDDDDPTLSLMMKFYDSLSPEGQAYVREYGIDAEQFEAWLRGMTPQQLRAQRKTEEQEKDREIAKQVLAKIIERAPQRKKLIRRV